MEERERKKFILKNSLYALCVLGFFMLGEIPNFDPLWVKSMPVISVVVAVAMHEGEMAGGVFGFFAGILVDTYASHVFGLSSAIFTILGTLCGLLVICLLQNNLRTAVILSLSFAAIYGIMTYYFTYAMWEVEGRHIFFFLRTVPQIIVSGLWAFLSYPLIKKIDLKIEASRR